MIDIADEAVVAASDALEALDDGYAVQPARSIRVALAAAAPYLVADAWDAAANGAEEATELPKVRWWLREQTRIARKGGNL